MSQDAAERLAQFLGRVPYVKFLGMTAELAGDEMTATLDLRPAPGRQHRPCPPCTAG